MAAADAESVTLRDVETADLAHFYLHQRDPEALRLAAVAPRDRPAFQAHWLRILADPEGTVQTVLHEGRVSGYVTCWRADDKWQVGYWLAREAWGRGVATRALRAFLARVPWRPLHAAVAEHNAASRRVLEKCGFVLIPEASTRGADGIVENVLVLAGPALPAL